MIKKMKMVSDFTTISNEIIRDRTLSLQAKGLFLTLASLPESWIVNKTQLHNFSCDGKYATGKAFEELVAAGYIKKGDTVYEKGKFKSSDYIVYPTKQPLSENLTSKNLIAENQSLLKKQTTNKETEEIKKEKHTQSASSFFSNEGNQPTKQKPKQPSRENGKPKATDTIDVRKKKFWAEIVVASRTVSTTQESAEAFNDHYTSTDINNPNLMRFEDDRFWNTEKKLKKWMKLEKPDYKDWDND
jgi:hypothetical protein